MSAVLPIPNVESERLSINKDTKKLASKKAVAHIQDGSLLNDRSDEGAGQSKKKFKFSYKGFSSLAMLGILGNKKSLQKRIIGIFNTILDSYVFIGLMMILTLYVLFISDLDEAFMSSDADSPIDITLSFALFCFTTEIVLASMAQKDYLLSFFFWLDFISTISIIQDIDFIFAPLVNAFTDNSGNNSSKTKNIVRTVSAGRVTRVLRIVRIIRLIRIVKLYKATIQSREAIKKKQKARERMLKKETIVKREVIMEKPSNASDVTLAPAIKVTNNLNSPLPIIMESPEIAPQKKLNIFSKKQRNTITTAPIEPQIVIDSKQTEKPINIFKNLGMKLQSEANQGSTSKSNSEPEVEQELVKETNISKVISESITKKLIILILGLILGLSIINEDMYLSETPDYSNYLGNFFDANRLMLFNKTNQTISRDFVSTDFDLVLFHADVEQANFDKIQYDDTNMTEVQPLADSSFYSLNQSNPPVNITANGTVTNNNDTLIYLMLKSISIGIDTPFPIINITYYNDLIFVDSYVSITPFRSNEVSVYVSDDQNIVIYYSIYVDEVLKAELNIGKTLFIMLIIVAGAVIFEKDTRDLILDPLEVMIEIVEMVENDPIVAKSAENLKQGIKSQVLKNDEAQSATEKKKRSKKIVNSEKYEVKMIENSIIKISSLLAICFGEAGGDIIKQNLEKGKDFNPMLEGRKKQAIFGFCDIRQFPSVNDALQERTMIFVNQISEIVHSSVDRFGGATNKNIGDAYLSAWRFIKEVKNNKGNKEYTEIKVEKDDKDIQFIADQAVLGFLQVIIRINSEEEILAYKEDTAIINHPELVNYKVKMGFGLHVGWAIEGAIGSTYKIDASYLSPNVNISARLEAATKQYGVLFLISGELYDLCSDQIKEICRLIDIVAVKGSINPIRLYTIDVNIYNLPKVGKKSITSAKKRYELFMKIKEKLHFQAGGKYNFVNYVLSNKCFKRLLRLKRNPNFLPVYENGIREYIAGNWEQAEIYLKQSLELDPSDGPAKTIYAYLESQNFKAEKEGDNMWRGFRSLNSK